MTAKARRAQRAPDETDEPNSGKLPEGNRDGEPQPNEPEPSVDLPESDEDDEPEPAKEPAPVPTSEVKKSTTSERPSLLARFAKFWLTDLDGN